MKSVSICRLPKPFRSTMFSQRDACVRFPSMRLPAQERYPAVTKRSKSFEGDIKTFCKFDVDLMSSLEPLPLDLDDGDSGVFERLEIVRIEGITHDDGLNVLLHELPNRHRLQ